jgi:putative addiction module component (TIGR02574 family)
MSLNLHTLGIDQLSREERIDLVLQIWDSIASEPNPQPMLSEAQRQELERRLADDDANPHDIVPWEQIKADLQSRLKS